jgi:ABC-type bacteriocin/lantibiotic exporter with double-glycine peptidase domain
MEFIYSVIAGFFGIKTNTLKFYFDYKSGIVKYLLLDSPLKVVAMFAGFVLPVITQSQINILTGGDYSHDRLVQFSILIASVALYQILLSLLSTIIDWKTKAQKNYIRNYYTDKYIAKLELLDKGKFHANTESLIGDVRDIVGYEYQNIINLITLILTVPATIIGFILVAKYINATMVVVIFVNSVVSFGINVYRSEVYKKSYLKTFEKTMMFSRIKNRFFYDFSDLNLNGKILQVKNLYSSTRTENDEASLQQHVKYGRIGLIDSTISQFTNVGLGVFAGYLVFSGQMTIGAYTVYPSYNDKASKLVDGFSEIFSKLQELKLSLIKLQFVLELESTVNFEGTQAIQSVSTIEFAGVQYSYEDLSVLNNNLILQLKALNTPNKIMNNKYIGWIFKLFFSDSNMAEEINQLTSDIESEEQSKIVLKDLSFKLSKGDFVSIVGSNGCGKTTAWSMLMKGLAPQSGSILLNGSDIDIYENFSLKRQILMISQKQYLMRGFTIEKLLNFDNDPGITRAHMEEVTKFLGLKFSDEDYLKKMGDDIELSGGQEQLVLMSSVFLNKYKNNKSSVVILDEGTNQMDPDKKNQVIKGIRIYLDDCITVLVSHEMELCMATDRVLVFQEGQVSDEGTPQHLLSYDNLFSQFKGEKVATQKPQLVAA